MAAYEITGSYFIKEWIDPIILNADDPDQAEEFAVEQIKELYQDAEVKDIEIDSIKEIK